MSLGRGHGDSPDTSLAGVPWEELRNVRAWDCPFLRNTHTSITSLGITVPAAASTGIGELLREDRVVSLGVDLAAPELEVTWQAVSSP